MNTSSRTVDAVIASAAILMAMSSNSGAKDPWEETVHHVQHKGHAGQASNDAKPISASSIGEEIDASQQFFALTFTPASSRSGSSYLTEYSYFVDHLAALDAKPVNQRPLLPDLAAPAEMIAWAGEMISNLPEGIRLPAIWADEGEIAFEWKWGERHAILSIEEDGTVGYAMLNGQRFLPGHEIGSVSVFPQDLLNYLTEA